MLLKTGTGEIGHIDADHGRGGSTLIFFQHKCHLHDNVPRVKRADGKTTTRQVPWARKGNGSKLLFGALSMLLMENEMPVDKVAAILRAHPNGL